MKKIIICLISLMFSFSMAGIGLAADGTAETVIKVKGAISVMTAKIGPAGGTIEVEKDCPIKGFQIVIPQNAYKTEKTFEISYFEIPAGKYKGGGTPYSPLIIVNNGGGYAKGILSVKIPVKMPEGAFAMAGYIDPESFSIVDMLPVTELKKDYITSITKNFDMPFLVTGMQQ